MNYNAKNKRKAAEDHYSRCWTAVGVLLKTQWVKNNDITIVDRNADRLRELQDKYDLRVVNGYASHPNTLREAGAQVMPTCWLP